MDRRTFLCHAGVAAASLAIPLPKQPGPMSRLAKASGKAAEAFGNVASASRSATFFTGQFSVYINDKFVGNATNVVGTFNDLSDRFDRSPCRDGSGTS